MRKLIVPLMVIAAGAAVAAPASHLSGDYVEVRTASVFAGPCHYNGELTTTGRDAEMAWHVRDGAWKGVSLSGLSAVALVTSDENLKDESAPRRSVIIVDSHATPAQAKALSGALTESYGKALGQVIAVRQEPITFSRQGENYTVAVPGEGRMAVEAMPNHACCTQPELVWYNPLVPLQGRRVGYTRASSANDKTLGAEWTKNDQNTAFYGTFTL